MLSQSQRAALAVRLRRGRGTEAGSRIARRDPADLAPPASFGQEQLWFIDKFAPGRAVYNIPCVLDIRGALAVDALSRALDRLVERHEALRTRLVADATSHPVQVIDEPVARRLEVADLAGFEPGMRQARLATFIHAEAMRPIDLAAGPLLRVSLVRLSEAEHVLVAVIHHAVFDGWSAGVFVRDLAELYRAEVSGEPSGLAELPVQFADYAVWERQALEGQALAELESYWRRTMSGFETVQFPADRPRPVIDDFAGAFAERMTDAALLVALRELSRREDTTLFATLMAGLMALLHRYTGQTDLVVGTVSANRGRAQLAPLIGFLVNTLPIRCDLSGDPAFCDLLARVKDATFGAFAHQDLPFAKLVDTVGTERDPSRAPVFQISFTSGERDDSRRPAIDGVEFAPSDLVRGIDVAKFDLAFAVEARQHGLRLECNYKTALFDPDTIERLLAHLETLLGGVAADPEARLSELPLLTDAELRAELHDWNNAAVGAQAGTAPVPPGCVHEYFQAQAARTPSAVAAQYQDELVSYAELNRQANQIARRLRDLGVGPEVLIGVCMGTGPRRLAALLGVLKAGGGYVPLDPALPPERLAFMIADTGMTVVLTDTPSADSVPEAVAVTVVDVNAEWDHITGLDGGNLVGAGVTAANVAYVIYTSGSTGRPKGVVVEHRNAASSLHSMIGHWRIGPGSAVLQFASFTFDASVMDMFMPLLAGGRVVLAPAQTLHSPPRLAALLREARITFICLPPAVLDLLPTGEYPDLRVLMAGGDELPAEVVRRWIRPGLRLVNAYGPTETTVNATYGELDATTPMPPPIGRPARPHYQAYILDQYLNPVPAGVGGELHIGGASVARGYLNRPDLTCQRFIPDPFTPGQRLYKTGDLARRRPDGTIVFCGRIDHQVKIRGVRIELGEIEAVVATHPAIAQAVATVVVSPAGDKEVAAYLRIAPDTQPDLAAVRAHLARALPPAMIPAHLIPVEEFPLNSSGKVDKKALPAPARQVATGQEAPSTPTEKMLADLYVRLLDTPRPGAADSFFELGGNSLTAMRLVDLISREAGADLAVTEVFLHPRLRELAASIDAVKSGATRQAASGPVVKLSQDQGGQPLFLLHAVGGTVSGYAQLSLELADSFTVYGLQSPGLDDVDALDTSLADLVTGYTRRIQAVQPTGPYQLAGWSMGGVIAFEIAKRLEQAGADVALLVLMDAPFAVPADYVPEQEASGAPGEALLAGRFVTDVAHTMGWDTANAPDPVDTAPARQLSWLTDRLTQGGGDLSERDATGARLRRRWGVFAAHSRMMAGYQPTAPQVLAPTLIVSADASPNAPTRHRWPLVLGGPVTTLCVDSDHYAFLRPPLVHDLGAAIRKWREGHPDGLRPCVDEDF